MERNDGSRLAMLRRIEWHTVYRWGDPETECPECEGDPYSGHQKGCELQALIQEFEASAASAAKPQQETPGVPDKEDA